MPREDKLNIVPRFSLFQNVMLGTVMTPETTFMRHHLPWGLAISALLCSCGSTKTLSVASVDYQALRTEFAQPETIPGNARIAVEYFFNSNGEIQPVVYNLTSEIMILDQTKSFVIMPDGSSVSYYDPTVRTSTSGSYSSSTEGRSFNLGGIAGALGIGGAIGSLLGATTVGSSNTTGLVRQNTVTIADQPMVNIGPKGSVAMSKAYKVSGVGFANRKSDNYVDVPHHLATDRFSVCISYSIDEGATFDKLMTPLYISTSLRETVNDRKISDAFDRIYIKKPDALAESLYMFLIPNNAADDKYVRGSLIDYQ